MSDIDKEKLKDLKKTVDLFNDELSESKDLMQKIEVKVKARLKSKP